MMQSLFFMTMMSVFSRANTGKEMNERGELDLARIEVNAEFGETPNKFQMGTWGANRQKNNPTVRRESFNEDLAYSTIGPFKEPAFARPG
jgi:hypothetical protein